MSKNEDMLSVIKGSTVQLLTGILFGIGGMLLAYKGYRFIIRAVNKYIICWHCR